MKKFLLKECQFNQKLLNDLERHWMCIVNTRNDIWWNQTEQPYKKWKITILPFNMSNSMNISHTKKHPMSSSSLYYGDSFYVMHFFTFMFTIDRNMALIDIFINWKKYMIKRPSLKFCSSLHYQNETLRATQKNTSTKANVQCSRYSTHVFAEHWKSHFLYISFHGFLDWINKYTYRNI